MDKRAARGTASSFCEQSWWNWYHSIACSSVVHIFKGLLANRRGGVHDLQSNNLHQRNISQWQAWKSPQMQLVKDNWEATSHTSTLFWWNMKTVHPTSYAVFTSSFSGRNTSAKCKLLGKVTMPEAYQVAANSITEKKKKAIPVFGIIQEVDLEDLSLLLDWDLWSFLPSQPPPVAFLFLLLIVTLQFLLLTSKQPLLLRNGFYFCLAGLFWDIEESSTCQLLPQLFCWWDSKPSHLTSACPLCFLFPSQNPPKDR